MIEPQTGLMASTDTPDSSGDTVIPLANGLVPMMSLDQVLAEEKSKARENNNRPVIQGLAAYVRECWSAAWKARRTTNVEDRMLKSLRQRRGEYDPDVLADIKKAGGSDIYMMLSSTKARAATSWIRDAILGQKDEKPWTIDPTPIPDLPPVIANSVAALATQEAQQYEQMTGQMVQQRDMEKIVGYVKDRIVANAKKRAKEACERMELKMEDQLVEGNFTQAMSEFIEDITTFPSAFIEGPIIRKKPQLSWSPEGEMIVEDKIVEEWERLDPFMVYPMPHVTNVDDGGLCVRRKMTRKQLNALRDVSGYNKAAIDAVLDEYGKGGLNEWLYLDSAKAAAEGRSTTALMSNPEQTIDAVQFRGSIQGKMLQEWGSDEIKIEDPLKDYEAEVWLIGEWVIKAELNADPLGRKNVFKASYEEIPGAFWGNSVMDLCRDSQIQCNNAARAIANNVGIGSGPQVGVNVDRLPAGEDLTQVYPYKIWQFTSDPYGSSQQPLSFFMPPMVAAELMQVFMFWSNNADESTGIPRYLAGDAQGQGALRTSSGISMLMNNAGKGIKQVVANIDVNVITKLIERLHYHNMRYGEDPALKMGDIKIRARGAGMLVIKETQAQRSNEFLQLMLSNPQVQGIVGEEALVELIRDAAKNIGMADKLPPPEVIRSRMMQQQQQAAQAQKAQQDFQMAMSLAPSHEVEMERGPDGEVIGMKVIDKQQHVMSMPGVAGPMGGAPQGANPAQTMSNPNQQTGGFPVTDSFSPMRTR